MQDATFSRNYALPSGATHLAAWWRDAPNATGRLTSFIVERWGSRALLRSSWHVHRSCGQSVFTVDTLTVDTAEWLKLNILTAGWVFFWEGRGAYAQDKNTSARLCAKNAGGLMHEGGRICGTLQYYAKGLSKKIGMVQKHLSRPKSLQTWYMSSPTKTEIRPKKVCQFSTTYI